MGINERLERIERVLSTFQAAGLSDVGYIPEANNAVHDDETKRQQAQTILDGLDWTDAGIATWKAGHRKANAKARLAGQDDLGPVFRGLIRLLAKQFNKTPAQVLAALRDEIDND